MIAHSQPSMAGLAVVTAFAAVLFFGVLGVPGLHDADETRYAEIAREMLESGDFIVPQINYVPYLDKPPLVYWATCAGYKMFGLNALGARFFPAMCALAGVIAVYLFGCATFGERAGFHAALVLCTSSLYFCISQTLVLDMPLTLFVALAAGFLYLAWKRGARWLIPAYLSMALGAMIKGPVAVVLPMLPITLVALLRERPLAEGIKGIRRLISIGAVLAFLIVWAPWHIAIYFARPEFFPHFFLGENVGGFLSGSIHHPEPAYLTVCYLLLGFMPWTFFLPAAVETFSSLKDDQRDAAWSCLAWAGVIVLIFTLSVSKLPTYVLPALPPLALLVGAAVPSTRRLSLPSRAFVVVLGVAACVCSSGAAALVGPHFGGVASDIRNLSAVCLLFSAALTISLIRSAGKLSFALGVLFVPFCCAFLCVARSPGFIEYRCARRIAAAIQERGDLRKVATFRQQHPNLNFYLHQQQIIVDRVPRQYRLGLRLGYGRDAFISSRALRDLASSEPGVYCLVRQAELGEFERLFNCYFRRVFVFTRDNKPEHLFVSTGKPSEKAPPKAAYPDYSLSELLSSMGESKGGEWQKAERESQDAKATQMTKP